MQIGKTSFIWASFGCFGGWGCCWEIWKCAGCYISVKDKGLKEVVVIFVVDYCCLGAPVILPIIVDFRLRICFPHWPSQNFDDKTQLNLSTKPPMILPNPWWKFCPTLELSECFPMLPILLEFCVVSLLNSLYWLLDQFLDVCHCLEFRPLKRISPSWGLLVLTTQLVKFYHKTPLCYCEFWRENFAPSLDFTNVFTYCRLPKWKVHWNESISEYYVAGWPSSELKFFVVNVLLLHLFWLDHFSGSSISVLWTPPCVEYY